MAGIDESLGDLVLREALHSDCRTYWQWANDSTVRKMAVSSDPISWEEHSEWFKGKMADGDSSYLFVLESSMAGPIGQIRYDKTQEKKFLIDISVDREYRALKLGRMLLSMGQDALTARTPTLALQAFVKFENKASISLFESDGFEEVVSHGRGLGVVFEKKF